MSDPTSLLQEHETRLAALEEMSVITPTPPHEPTDSGALQGRMDRLAVQMQAIEQWVDTLHKRTDAQATALTRLSEVEAWCVNLEKVQTLLVDRVEKLEKTQTLLVDRVEKLELEHANKPDHWRTK